MINNAWIALASDFIPDSIKSHQWRMWEYRTLYLGIRKKYGIQWSYELMRILLDNYQLFQRLRNDVDSR